MTWVSLGLLFLLGGIWGASFLFIKIAVRDLGPLTLAASRVLVGALILLAINLLRGERLPRERIIWLRFAVTGLVGMAIPFGAISWGTQYIASGLSSILNATMPLFTFAVAIVLAGERFTWARVAGLLIGFAGIAVLTLPALQAGVQSELRGQLAIVVASLAYAVSIVFARRYLVSQPPLVAALGQVSTALVFLLPLSLLERPWTMSLTMPAVSSAVALGVFGTAVAYVIYYRLLRVIGAPSTSLVTYIVPLFGVAWGTLLLDEVLTWHAFAALGLIFGGLLLVNGLPRASRR
jgi:drug/metabolite transporter (DMT)-like permease